MVHVGLLLLLLIIRAYYLWEQVEHQLNMIYPNSMCLNVKLTLMVVMEVTHTMLCNYFVIQAPLSKQPTHTAPTQPTQTSAQTQQEE